MDLRPFGEHDRHRGNIGRVIVGALGTVGGLFISEGQKALTRTTLNNIQKAWENNNQNAKEVAKSLPDKPIKITRGKGPITRSQSAARNEIREAEAQKDDLHHKQPYSQPEENPDDIADPTDTPPEEEDDITPEPDAPNSILGGGTQPWRRYRLTFPKHHRLHLRKMGVIVPR